MRLQRQRLAILAVSVDSTVVEILIFETLIKTFYYKVYAGTQMEHEIMATRGDATL